MLRIGGNLSLLPLDQPDSLGRYSRRPFESTSIRRFKMICGKRFMVWQQNGWLMAQYITEFKRLAKMFPNIVPTTWACSQLFLRGLDPLIQRMANTISPDDFCTVVEIARCVERFEEAISSEDCKDEGII